MSMRKAVQLQGDSYGKEVLKSLLDITNSLKSPKRPSLMMAGSKQEILHSSILW
jgi:hypothetical protein